MLADRRTKLARILAHIDAKIREAEALTVGLCDADTLNRASKVLAELKEQKRGVEAKLRAEKSSEN
jgi:hypothetical protein